MSTPRARRSCCARCLRRATSRAGGGAMAESTHEQTEQAADTGREQPEAPADGAGPSGAVGTGVALTIGGAVVGALVALLRGRGGRPAGTEGRAGAELADELTERAAAAA